MNSAALRLVQVSIGIIDPHQKTDVTVDPLNAIRMQQINNITRIGLESTILLPYYYSSRPIAYY